MLRKLFCVSVLTALFTFMLSAQAIDFNGVIPPDPETRVGRLENGMTYYIRHNNKPEKQAEFFIYHDVGAIQEEDSQIGLAHFLEHMAFNGTVNLPGKQLIDYLETVGVKFGANLNAGTGQEFTVYMMQSVPVTREGIIDTALLILHDWSHFIALEGDEIDNERGVIIEELRTGNTAARRVMEKSSPYTYNNSRYAFRNVIGEEEHLRTFDHQLIRDFYHRWYRPDLQAIVVVGDINVDQVEAKLIKLMADIPAVENPEEKIAFPIPDNTEPIVAVITDPELRNSSVNFMIKREPVPNDYNSMVIIRKVDTILDIMDKIIGYRLHEITNQENAPFISAFFGNSTLTVTSDALYGHITARDGETLSAFEALYTEVEKIRRYGFTESELERAQNDLLRAAQKEYDNRNDRRNGDFVWQYISNFRKNTPMPSAEYAWELDSLLISTTMLMEVNMTAQQLITPDNQVVIVQSPEKDGISIPTEADILAVMEKVRNAELEPYQDDVVKEPLITKELAGTPVVSTGTDIFGSTVWTLGNGAKVVIKPTDFKADEVIMSVNSKGGLSILSDEDYFSGSLLGDLVVMSGVGKFSAVDLSKQLSGKVARIAPAIQNYENGFSGSASVKDFETFMQLLYLYFTEPRFAESDFNRLLDRYRTQLVNAENNPNFVFADNFYGTLYGNNPRRNLTKIADLEKADFNRMAEIYRELYRNADDFTFTFVGNLDLNEIQPLVEKYIGSLPSTPEKFGSVDDGVRIQKGDIVNRFTTKMETPKTSVAYAYSGEMAYTLENKLHIETLAQILSQRYHESIREEKGGTYGVGVYAQMHDEPVQDYMLQIVFDTDPGMVDELTEIIIEEIENIAANGPRQDDLSKVIEFLVKQRADDLRKNMVWTNFIDTYYVNNIDITSDYEQIVANMNGDAIKAMAAKVLADGNLIRVIMDPEK